MKLELLDAYNVRARLSPSIILLAPIAITLFLCFEEIRTLASSSVIIFVLLAFTNYVPILQRRINKGKTAYTNYAVQFLYPEDTTLSAEKKLRYCRKLSELDPSLELLAHPESTKDYRSCCSSAVSILRNKTRDHRLVQEENINYGFCKNLLASKQIGIVFCIICTAFTIIISLVRYKGIGAIPTENWFAVIADIGFLLFWIFGINQNVLDEASKQYARTLLASVDSLE